MIVDRFLSLSKYAFVILTLLFFSCEEETVLILNPGEDSSIEYEFKVFNLDVDNSGTIREGFSDNNFGGEPSIFEGEPNIDYESMPLSNSGLSSRLYLGVIDNASEYNNGLVIPEENPSYVYIKIKNSLIKENFFCEEVDDIRKLNKIDLKIPTLTDTENLYNSQYYDFNDIVDCTSLDDEDECNNYSNCFWYRQIDDMGDIQVESCETYYDNQTEQINQNFMDDPSFNLGGDPGDSENIGSHFLKAYILSEASELESYTEDSDLNHTPDIFLAAFQDADEVPISISGTNDFISVDLKGHLFSEYNQETSNEDCSLYNYDDCICSSYVVVDDETVCDEGYLREECYWVWDAPICHIATGLCENNTIACSTNNDCIMKTGMCHNETNYVYNDNQSVIQSFCDGNNDIHLLLEYSSLSEIPSNQIIELYSSDEDFLYNNPYLYLNYLKVDEKNIDVKKYKIDSISAANNECLDNGMCSQDEIECEDDSDCENLVSIDSDLFRCGSSDNCEDFSYSDVSCIGYDAVANNSCDGILDNGKNRCSNDCSICEVDSDCINYDSWGMILGQSNYNTYFDYVDGDCQSDVCSGTNNPCTSDFDCLQNCSELDENSCDNFQNCFWNENSLTCAIKLIEPIIESGFDKEIFKYTITLENNYEYLDYNGDPQTLELDFNEISFKFKNSNVGDYAFVYVDDDPSNDNWNDCGSDGDCLYVDSNDTQNNDFWDPGENEEGNNIWDCDDETIEDCEYNYGKYEKFDDFGFDRCLDNYEKGNKWVANNDGLFNCYDINDVLNDSPIQSIDENDCLCSDVENYKYNPTGTENNGQLNWIDQDENNEWNECEGSDIFCEGERWYNLGYDHVHDDFESGCFNDDNPYGSDIIYWDYIDSNTWGNHLFQPSELPELSEGSYDLLNYSYKELINAWKSLPDNSDKDVEDLYDHTFQINDLEITICGGAYWESNCYSDACSLSDPNGDNLNIDPLGDNYDEEMNINGTEGNEKWDGIVGINSTKCNAGDCEFFHDYGLDRLKDIYETYNYEVDDDNFTISNASELPLNSIYLVRTDIGNEIWYNVSNPIKEYSFLLPCANVTSVTQGEFIDQNSSGTLLFNNNFSQNETSGTLAMLSFCENTNQENCEINEFCRWDGNECQVNGLPPLGFSDIEFIDNNDDLINVQYYNKTENNGRWDWKDMNGNCVFDEELDLHEQFFDNGVDQIESKDELSDEGEKYNSFGFQGNYTYDSIQDFYEKFDDFGLDGKHDNDEADDAINDNYNIDPNLDNYNATTNINGFENNGKLDWLDCGDDGLCDEDEPGYDPLGIDGEENTGDENLDPSGDNLSIDYPEGTENNGIWNINETIIEEWYDWGYDHVENTNENNYMANLALVSLGNNNLYTMYLDELGEPEFIENVPPDTDSEIYMWISRIEKDLNEENRYHIYISLRSLVDVVAFQFQLDHVNESLEISDEITSALFLYPHEFIDSDGDNFPDISPINELVAGGEKYFEDASIYKLVDNYDVSKLRVNYGQGLKSVLNFYDNSNPEVSFEEFVDMNPNSIISDEHTKLVFYFSNSNPEHHINDRINFTLEYFNQELNENVIFYNSYITNYFIYSNTDSLEIDISPFIQKYTAGEIDFNNITIGASSAYNNFSNVLIINDDEKYNPRLEIFYSK